MSSLPQHAVRAIYHNGRFSLLEPLTLPEGSEVELTVRLQDAQTTEGTTRPPRGVAASRLAALVGLVVAGGDAVADSEALYDADCP